MSIAKLRGNIDSHRRRAEHGFTLLEVMIAMAVLGLALFALLGLHNQDLRSVIRAQDVTRAAMLAQTLMSQAELEKFPQLGATTGGFEGYYPGQYPGFRWQRVVQESGVFPDVRKVRVIVLYGPGLNRSFSLTEFLHNPTLPAEEPAQGQ